MSHPTRYIFKAVVAHGEPALLMQTTEGKNSFVSYSDYAALAAEFDGYKRIIAQNFEQSIERELLLKQNAALAAENERLNENINKLCNHGDLEIARLTSENERLRKAGDAMAKSLAFEYPNSPKVAAWVAAKEGRDAK